MDDYSSLIKKINGMLNKEGQLIFSQEHPILTAGEMGVILSDPSEGINIKRYSLDGERHVMWLGKEITKYHRKVSTIINTLQENGFTVEKIVEPIPSQELIEKNEKMLTELQRPSYIVIKARKGANK